MESRQPFVILVPIFTVARVKPVSHVRQSYPQLTGLISAYVRQCGIASGLLRHRVRVLVADSLTVDKVYRLPHSSHCKSLSSEYEWTLQPSRASV